MDESFLEFDQQSLLQKQTNRNSIRL